MRWHRAVAVEWQVLWVAVAAMAQGGAHSCCWIHTNSTLRGFGLTLTTNNNQSDDGAVTRVGRVGVAMNEEAGVTQQSGVGLEMTVMNPASGSITFRKTFSIGLVWGHYLDLQWHIGRLQPGSLVALQVSATGIEGLRDAAFDLQDLGSVLSTHLPPTAHWIWIFVKGGKTIVETAVTETENAVFCHAPILFYTPVHNKSGTDFDENRWKYCQNHESHGEFCNLANSYELRKPVDNRFSFKGLENVPLIITAGNRPYYLSETLLSLLAAPGFQPSNTTVLIGEPFPATCQLLDILGLNYTILEVKGVGNSKLFQFYRRVYEYVQDNLGNAKAVMFLDEDVRVSPDFFYYMSQVIPVMLADSTLYCASAYSPHYSAELYNRKDTVKRGSAQVMWGYAIPMSFIKRALRVWSHSPENVIVFDLWLMDFVAGGRECIFPEMSRSKHFGIGMNTRSTEFERYSAAMKLVPEAGINITNLNDIPLKSWEKIIERKISTSIKLSGNPCMGDIFANLPNGTYLFPYYIKEEDDGFYYLTNYFIIGECVGFSADSDNGWHEGVTLLRLREGVDLTFISVPLSRYSRLVNENCTLWNVDELSSEDKRETLHQIRKYYTVKRKELDRKFKEDNITEMFRS